MATETHAETSAQSDLPNWEKNSLTWTDHQKILKSLASLKISVVLFSLSIFLVLAGTLAQAEKDIWEVVSQYFRCWFAWIEFRVFFPPAWFPELKGKIQGGFPFPGGWLIGTAMTINLLAAHSMRFKVQAKGAKLLLGLILTALGTLLTWFVIETGSARDGVHEGSMFDWETVWNIFRVGLGVSSATCLAIAMNLPKRAKTEFWLWGGSAVLLGGVAVWMFASGDAARLNESSMRILWQLVKATLAGLVLLAGCMLLFKKRAGIVLLHAGVLLIMFNEVVVHRYHVETQMTLLEGESRNYAEDTRTFELVVTDASNPEEVREVVVPKRYFKEGAKVTHENLPFDIEVKEFMANSTVADPNSDDHEDKENPADAGFGTELLALEADPVSGVDMNKRDMPAAYVTFYDKDDNKKIGTYLLRLLLRDQEIEVDGETYEIAFRNRRYYKDYTIHLKDIRKEDYIGTNTPRDYSSYVKLVDPSRNVDRDIRIWMNNPLRFAGETFYQSNYDVERNLDGTPKRNPDGSVRELTGLQIVTNEGWMIPYVGCMIVAVGMIAQFMLSLSRFLNRWADGRLQYAPTEQITVDETTKDDVSSSSSDMFGILVPGLTVLIMGGWMLSKAPWPDARSAANLEEAKEMSLYAVGQIPVAYEGRVKPLDTIARNTMRIISNRETFYDVNENKHDAIKWLMDLLAKPAVADGHPIIRIENNQVRYFLDLPKRKSMRYSYAEIATNIEKMTEELKTLKEKDEADYDTFERKLVTLWKRLQRVELLRQAFVPIDLSAREGENQFQSLGRKLSIIPELKSYEENIQPPLLIPPDNTIDWEAINQDLASGPPILAQVVSDVENSKNDWRTVVRADVINELFSDFNAAASTSIEAENRFVGAFEKIVDAYRNNEKRAFNDAVANYKEMLRDGNLELFKEQKTDYEAFFNGFSPFFYAGILYLFAFLLTVTSWLTGLKVLNKSAFWLLLFTFAMHTYALCGRIYISGRPPVTNLYSSAVFIGWAGLVFSIVIELIIKRGFGNAVGGFAGFMSLWIAHGLAGDGDTFKVLQAVLDTQFWLSTHVVTITLGYAATFIAGIIGALYIILGVLTPVLSKNNAKNLIRMTYGVLCFALFFSFVGTVLGGLWADDSWGRFWGWDPKENGALIIVLWNALVLHARWDGMAKSHGLAMLAVAGNITTSWSWFGVNELGVGLHSYGFTEGVLMLLACFAISQLAIIGLAWIPVRYWRSGDKLESEATA